MPSDPIYHNHSLLTDHDIFLFKQGKHFQLYNKLGSRPIEFDGLKGTYFAVWAPNGESVNVIGNFNGWNRYSHPLAARWDSSGIWEGFIPGIGQGEVYKYFVRSKIGGREFERGDPFAFHFETPPRTASIVWDVKFDWDEEEWKGIREKKNGLSAPISIYEMHFGSWRRHAEQSRPLTYLEMAEILPKYLQEMGFTHVEFMPMMEHPFYGSWGYQQTGYFAPTSRFGTPQDFMMLIQALHKHGIGVYLDWVPSHFPSDEHGLAFFDGSCLYEHSDPRQGFHPEWRSYIFNYSRHEVRSFLISSAAFWMEKFHVEGLRVDGVSSMLYLNYARNHGDWIPNIHGGHENLDAIYFLRELNEYLYQKFPYIQMIAEESTAWPMVSRPVDVGGLGFGMKWCMGWMHDTLKYFAKDPIYRKYHHNELLFSMLYFYNENFVLSISHDEVVYGKQALLRKMPGDDWQKYANLRLLFAYMYTHPGKKLLFMGSELGQWDEWNHDSSLDWHLLQYPPHQGIQKILKDLNHLYQTEPALYEIDFEREGFEWLALDDAESSVIAYLRKDGDNPIAVVCNFTPVVRDSYFIPVPFGGIWKEIFNSDAAIYGGSGKGNLGEKLAETRDLKNEGPNYLNLTLPPLALLMFKFIPS